MNKPFPAYHQGRFSPVQKKFQLTYTNLNSPRLRSPQSPKSNNIKTNSPQKLSNQQTNERIQLMNLQINSAKNSADNQHRKQYKNLHIKIQKSPILQNNENNELNLFLPQKMINLQKKSNRLLQKVLAIQQQIQKYAEVQQKQLRPIGYEVPSSPLLQTKSLLSKRNEVQQLDPIQIQHQQNLRKMNILGKNKVKMIQNLQNHIQKLQQKVTKPEIKQQQKLQQQKKEIDSKFANYYKHKNDILKQSKSQKFSFRHLKYLTKQNKYQKSDFGDQIMQKFESKQNQQNLQIQLKKLKQQFSSYQQRTSKQLQNYKERLNQNILQKQILKKQLERQKYENLKQKLFNKNRPPKSSRYISPQRTSREYIQPRLFLDVRQEQKVEQKPVNQLQSNIQTLMNFPKTDRPTNDQQPQFEDLQQFKDQVSMRYIQQNQQIQQLHQKIKDMQYVIQDLRNKLQKSQTSNLVQVQQLKNLIQQKQKIIIQISQMNQHSAQQIQDLKNQINDMNNYIFQCKQQNQSQHQQIEQYKNVIQEFVEEIKILRNQNNQKNIINQQLTQQILQAENINKLCQNQIKQLERNNLKLNREIQKLQNAIKLKQAKQRYNQALLAKQKLHIDSLNQSSFGSQISTKNQSKIQNNSHKQNNDMKKNTQSNKSEAINQQEIQNKIRKINQQNQQKLDLQRIQFDKYLKQKQAKIQQLEQNLQLIKSDIKNKVDQQVNQGIRTFLRYRKHTNHLQHQNIKCLIYGKKIYQGQKLQHITFDLNFKQIKLTKNKVLTCRTDRSTNGSNLSLRKLIDSKLINRNETPNDSQLAFKLHISIKLIEFVIQLLLQQNSMIEVASSKSLKPSNKKLPNLNPQSIFIIDSSQMMHGESQISQNQSESLSLQQKLQNIGKDYKNYQFIYIMNNKKQSQKKDKNLLYLSPQVLLSMNESQNSYCWTLGIIIDEIFNNGLFYTKIDEIVTRKDNYKFKNTKNYQEKVSLSLKQILENMIKKNLKQRPSLNKILNDFNSLL